jgi:hypothetical protein
MRSREVLEVIATAEKVYNILMYAVHTGRVEEEQLEKVTGPFQGQIYFRADEEVVPVQVRKQTGSGGFNPSRAEIIYCRKWAIQDLSEGVNGAIASSGRRYQVNFSCKP